MGVGGPRARVGLSRADGDQALWEKKVKDELEEAGEEPVAADGDHVLGENAVKERKIKDDHGEAGDHQVADGSRISFPASVKDSIKDSDGSKNEENLVWARKPSGKQRLWWPAILDGDVPTSSLLYVRFICQSNYRRRIPREDVVPFYHVDLADVHFDDISLQSAVRMAEGMSRRGRCAWVKCRRVEMENELGKGGDEWKSDFLASLDDDEFEDRNKENKNRKDKFKLRLSFRADEDDGDLKEKEGWEENDSLEEGEEWKTTFLASLDLDKDEDKENNGGGDCKENRKRKRMIFPIRFEMDENEEDDDVLNRNEEDYNDEDKENDGSDKRPTELSEDGNLPEEMRPCLREPKRIPLAEIKRKSFLHDDDNELSEYDRIRIQNIADKKAILDELKICKTLVKESVDRKQQAKTRRRIADNSIKREPIVTRPKNKRPNYDESRMGVGACLISMTRKRLYEEMQLDDVDDKESSHPDEKRRKSTFYSLSPDEVTEEMLDNVADRVSEKIYDKEIGTSCHQCRQKTADTKTVCRSGRCVGVRGMFCGVCLANRYGENAREALKDPGWVCPPCLGNCNCSICRNRLGKGATGAVTFLAQEKGFRSVKEFLESLKQGGN